MHRRNLPLYQHCCCCCPQLICRRWGGRASPSGLQPGAVGRGSPESWAPLGAAVCSFLLPVPAPRPSLCPACLSCSLQQHADSSFKCLFLASRGYLLLWGWEAGREKKPVHCCQCPQANLAPHTAAAHKSSSGAGAALELPLHSDQMEVAAVVVEVAGRHLHCCTSLDLPLPDLDAIK